MSGARSGPVMSKLLEQAQQEMRLDMTPMIDVVFLLIIFFLCIDFRVLEAKLPAYLPREGTGRLSSEPRDVLRVEIHVDQAGVSRLRDERNPAAGHYFEGHEVEWKVGPKPIRGLVELKETLSSIAKDESRLQRNAATGQLEPMPVVIEPGPGVAYGDTTQTADAVQAAGFREISFGNSLAQQPKK